MIQFDLDIEVSLLLLLLLFELFFQWSNDGLQETDLVPLHDIGEIMTFCVGLREQKVISVLSIVFTIWLFNLSLQLFLFLGSLVFEGIFAHQRIQTQWIPWHMVSVSLIQCLTCSDCGVFLSGIQFLLGKWNKRGIVFEGKFSVDLVRLVIMTQWRILKVAKEVGSWRFLVALGRVEGLLS